MGPAFTGYAQFAPPAAVMSPRGHHPAFYPQPILYWGYPSPPVSPTAYYGPAGHPPPPHHMTANLSPQHQATLVSILFVLLDFLKLLWCDKLENSFYYSIFKVFLDKFNLQTDVDLKSMRNGCE